VNTDDIRERAIQSVYEDFLKEEDSAEARKLFETMKWLIEGRSDRQIRKMEQKFMQ
jgi:hypothetical protein